MLCTHGIRGGIGAAAAHADRLRELGLFAEVHACAHKGEPRLLDTLAKVSARTVLLAPLLMAEAYTLRAMLHRLDGATRPEQTVLVCRPIGAHPRLVDVIAARGEARCAGRGWRPEDTALLLVAHGTERHPDSAATTRQHAAQIATRGRFAQVAVAFLDQAPRVPDALGMITAPQCVAVGLFVDQGEHGEEDVPALLAFAGERAVYAGPIGADPLITELILDQARAASTAVIAS